MLQGNVVQLGPGLKSETKALDQSRTLKSLSTPTHHHHPPTKTFKRVLGIIGGQDLVCRLHITQATRSRNFDPHSKKEFRTQKFVGPKTFNTQIIFEPQTFFYLKSFLGKIFQTKSFFGP